MNAADLTKFDRPGAMKVFTCYDPDTDTQFLIRVLDDGTGEFATRPGIDQRHITWSPPTAMRSES